MRAQYLFLKNREVKKLNPNDEDLKKKQRKDEEDEILDEFDFINDESNQTPFLIHCEIGVDRTGVFSAIFAGLCGATWEEIANDYETSNNLCIKEFRDAKILKYSFERMLKVEDITQEADIKSLLYNYFTSSGYISQSDLDSVVAKITAN